LDKKEDESMIEAMLNSLDIKELMSLGKQATEKYEVDPELYDFFHKQVVEVPEESE